MQTSNFIGKILYVKTWSFERISDGKRSTTSIIQHICLIIVLNVMWNLYLHVKFNAKLSQLF